MLATAAADLMISLTECSFSLADREAVSVDKKDLILSWILGVNKAV